MLVQKMFLFSSCILLVVDEQQGEKCQQNNGEAKTDIQNRPLVFCPLSLQRLVLILSVQFELVFLRGKVHVCCNIAGSIEILLGSIGILFQSPVSWVLIILSIIGILSPIFMAKLEKKAEEGAVSGTAEDIEKLTEEDSV